MKYIAMIQARAGSSRLRNKVLMEICGKPVLQHVIERVSMSKSVDEVIVITSVGRENLPILSLCAKLGTRVFVGSEDDVLDRYYQASRVYKSDYIIRVTADCPVFDGGLLDDAIESMTPEDDYLGMMSETFADGLDIEVFKTEALQKSWKQAKLQSEREHVTQYIKKHPEEFKLRDFVSPVGDFGDNRWTLDEKEDFELIKTIIEHFYSENIYDFTYKDVLNFVNANPDVRVINSRYSRNEGLQKSLNNDKELQDREE